METNYINVLNVKWKKILSAFILLLTVNGVLAEYDMENYCSDDLSFIWQTIYQAKLTLTDNDIYDKAGTYYPYTPSGYCEMTLEAWLTRFPKFMFYFEDFYLDCDKGHLEFYTGSTGNSSRVSGLEKNICGADKPQGVFTVNMQHFRIRYVPTRKQYLNDIFSIIITSYGDGSCPSYGHVCENSRCIDGDVACNGYNSCGDDSGCDLGTAAIVGIVIGGLVGLGMIISLVVCCFCCQKRSGIKTGTVQNITNPNMVNQTVYGQQGVNQTSPYGINPPPYQTVTSTNPGLNPSQQGNIRTIYGFNQ